MKYITAAAPSLLQIRNTNQSGASAPSLQTIMLSAQIDSIGEELRYITELLEVREKIRKLRDLYPTQKKDDARISFNDMTLLMAREFELMNYIKEEK